MPSYLSSTQTGEPSRVSTSASSATGEASIDFSGRNSASSAARKLVVARKLGRVPQVAGEHARPLDVGNGPIESGSNARLQVPLTQADAQLARQDLDDRFRRLGVATLEQLAQFDRLGGRAACGCDRGERSVDLGECRR